MPCCYMDTQCYRSYSLHFSELPSLLKMGVYRSCTSASLAHQNSVKSSEPFSVCLSLEVLAHWKPSFSPAAGTRTELNENKLLYGFHHRKFFLDCLFAVKLAWGGGKAKVGLQRHTAENESI